MSSTADGSGNICRASNTPNCTLLADANSRKILNVFNIFPNRMKIASLNTPYHPHSYHATFFAYSVPFLVPAPTRTHSPYSKPCRCFRLGKMALQVHCLQLGYEMDYASVSATTNTWVCLEIDDIEHTRMLNQEIKDVKPTCFFNKRY